MNCITYLINHTLTALIKVNPSSKNPKISNKSSRFLPTNSTLSFCVQHYSSRNERRLPNPSTASGSLKCRKSLDLRWVSPGLYDVCHCCMRESHCLPRDRHISPVGGVVELFSREGRQTNNHGDCTLPVQSRVRTVRTGHGSLVVRYHELGVRQQLVLGISCMHLSAVR